ncbi:hypothetical protein GCK32_004849 [Trichostrongylus colubriformis]
MHRTFKTLRRISRTTRPSKNCHHLVMKEAEDPNTVLFV